MRYGSYGYEGDGLRWTPYVSVGQKLSMARKQAAQVAKKQKRQPSPVAIAGHKIAKSFWGKAWCDNLKAYSDFSNRLSRGATYVRNGSVVDLVIKRGSIESIVAGSEPYTVKINIGELSRPMWNKIKRDCSASIDSLIDLLGGQISDGVMRRMSEKRSGCFPAPSEIRMKCSCPDYSYCCKHIAAVMYGVGSRLDSQPELLFVLRGVDPLELIRQAVSKENLDRELAVQAGAELAGEDLGEMFGIELDSAASTAIKPPKRKTVAASRPSATTVAPSRTASGKASKARKPANKPSSRSRGRKTISATAKGQAISPDSPDRVLGSRKLSSDAAKAR